MGSFNTPARWCPIIRYRIEEEQIVDLLYDKLYELRFDDKYYIDFTVNVKSGYYRDYYIEIYYYIFNDETEDEFEFYYNEREPSEITDDKYILRYILPRLQRATEETLLKLGIKNEVYGDWCEGKREVTLTPIGNTTLELYGLTTEEINEALKI